MPAPPSSAEEARRSRHLTRYNFSQPEAEDHDISRSEAARLSGELAPQTFNRRVIIGQEAYNAYADVSLARRSNSTILPIVPDDPIIEEDILSNGLLYLESMCPNGSNAAQREAVVQRTRAYVSDITAIAQPAAVGRHSARVLSEREADQPTYPQSWRQAQEQVPELKRWSEVKRAAGLRDRGPGFDQRTYDLLVTHLRDREHGWGMWATGEGLPKPALRATDDFLRKEIDNLGNPPFPSDISILNGNAMRRELPFSFPATIPVAPNADEVKAMRRILRRIDRGH